MANARPGRIRLLVVDDIPDTAESFARLLERMGFEATFVTDPRLAQAGFDAHVVKPVSVDLVRSILGTMFP